MALTPVPDRPDHDSDDALFDRSRYEREDLQIPKIDGQTIATIEVHFSGKVLLSRSDKSDVAVFNALRLGKDVTLTVEARCAATGAEGKGDGEGNLKLVNGRKTLKVHSLSKPVGGDWVEVPTVPAQ